MLQKHPHSNRATTVREWSSHALTTKKQQYFPNAIALEADDFTM